MVRRPQDTDKMTVLPSFGDFTGGHAIEVRAGHRIFVTDGGILSVDSSGFNGENPMLRGLFQVQSLIDLSNQVFRASGLGQYVYVRVVSVSNPEMFGDHLQKTERLRALLLSKEINLQIEMAAALIDPLLAVFRDHDEGAQENGF